MIDAKRRLNDWAGRVRAIAEECRCEDAAGEAVASGLRDRLAMVATEIEAAAQGDRQPSGGQHGQPPAADW